MLPAPPPPPASTGVSGQGSGSGSGSGAPGSPTAIGQTGLSVKGLAIPRDLPAFIQTAGANGTTALFSEQIRKMGEELLAKGEITEEQANYFYELANQGNRVATIEKLVEDALDNGTQTVTFEGKSYTPFELSRLVGWPDEPSSYYTMLVRQASDAINRSPNNRSETMQLFLSSYQKLEQSGGLNNPAVQQAVSAMSAKISYLSELVESNVSDQHWGNTTTPLDSYMASHTSYWSAAQICGAGSGETVGVTCQ